MACTDCHTVPTDTAHAAQPLNLTWSALAGNGTTPTWDAIALTCTNYCHGATLTGGTMTTPVWTSGSSQAACGTCHGLAPGTGHHSLHQGLGLDCGTCHGAGFSATSTSHAVNPSLHVNGVKDVAAGNPPGWDPATRSCTNSCHGRNSW
jgi:predicted CxxxxCH...CXXCH cytochrome family protein